MPRVKEEGFRSVLRLVREEPEVGVVLPRNASDAEVVPFLFDRIRGEPGEVMEAVFFDRLDAPARGYTIPYRGTETQVAAEQRHLIIKAWSSRAKGMIVFHNHLNGNVRPSEPDLAWTAALLALAAPLGVRVLDHLILGTEPRFGSLRDAGQIPGLGWDSTQEWSPDRIAERLEEVRLDAAKRPGGRRRARVKYRDPETGETWSGRGSMAGWLARHVAAGRDLEEFAVAPSNERRQTIRLD